MKLVFSRGQLILAADAQASAALSFVWRENTPEATGQALKRERLDDSLYAFDHDRLGRIFLSKKPWWSDLPKTIGERGLWLSFQGFSKNIWCDGVFGRWENGQW